MSNKLMVSLPLLAALMFQSCGNATTVQSDDVRIDQCGYLPTEPKMAFVEGNARMFVVVDNDGRVVFSDTAQSAMPWHAAGCDVSRLDFSAVQQPGKYTIVVDDTLASFSFEISENPYAELQKASVRAFYYNRASMAIDSLYGGKWSRTAGHPDTNVQVHSSAASPDRPEGTVLSLPGGWYDAGDYNKYVVNSGITTYTMLLAAKLFPQTVLAAELNIPESGNQLPDFIDETLYNLRWMLSMQDPNDGGAYHKLTALSFEDFIMPDKCQKQRYVVAKGTAATLDLAATAAFAARLLPQISQDLVPLADSCKQVAQKAWAWAEKNPNVLFRNPKDVSTGEYGDFMVDDEWFWAAIEMWLMTGDDKYAQVAVAKDKDYGVPTWGGVGTLAYFSLVADDIFISGLNQENSAVALADKLLKAEAASPVSLSLQDYAWGSNSSVANEAMVKLVAYKATGNAAYKTSALNDLHYILGRNGTGYCYVTGFGGKSPMNPHHRPSGADDVLEPVPGFLVGGPCTSVPSDCEDGSGLQRSKFPAKAYGDQQCSYSTNEIAINWNAPLAFVVFGVTDNSGYAEAQE